MVYGADGEVVEVVDPLGRSVTLSRDALSRIGGIVNPDGSKWELSFSQAGLVSMPLELVSRRRLAPASPQSCSASWTHKGGIAASVVSA